MDQVYWGLLVETTGTSYKYTQLLGAAGEDVWFLD